MNPKHFSELIIVPTLNHLGMYSERAADLLLGTALVESKLTALKQTRGPALGVYQIEPLTHADIRNYLRRKPDLQIPEGIDDYGMVLQQKIGGEWTTLVEAETKLSA